ncbi:cysteine-rich and transmembrane domain-containing protein WIH2-like [Juglans regia]|uniref:Cysteine-rich and transmembrane domain-containing protein WIH2-like n=2 Tax=Juglans regia TaxID=51240 RepID=A0A2I4GVI1_JUGRE|nr:cysteine-rich and transmembrane domain-containing protein WIH2-like [Juglans regia]
MSHYDQQQAPGAYPPPVTAYPPSYGPPQAVVDQGNVQVPNYYVAPPPPIGYPTRGTDAAAGYNPQHMPPVETTTRGEGFWKGCVAALCCCWVLDFCCC